MNLVPTVRGPAVAQYRRRMHLAGRARSGAVDCLLVSYETA